MHLGGKTREGKPGTGKTVYPTTIAAFPVFRSVALRALFFGSLAWASWNPTAAFAQPRPIVVSTEARPIEVASGAATTHALTTAPLRWRSKSGSVVQATAVEDSAPVEVAPVTLTLNGPSQINNNAPQPIQLDGQVHQVAQTTTAGSPFHDPFGDQGAAGGPRLAQGQLDNSVGPNRRPAIGSGSLSPEDIEGPPGNRGAFDPYGAPALTDPATETAPLNGGRPGCGRVYNERDCCDVDTTCRAFVSSLLADSIANVSLDITPRYMPDIDPQEETNTRIDRLRLAESREWRYADGRVMANGRLGTLANNRVVIVDDSDNEVARLELERLGEDERCFIAGWWRLPAECALNDPRGVQRNWMPSTYAWHASAACHKPLYFEEVQLERYGHTTGSLTQPIVSGAHFFASLATLPYQMAISPPMECEYALGYYRPGSCAPWHIPPVPFSVRGALAQTGFVVGGIYVLP